MLLRVACAKRDVYVVGFEDCYCWILACWLAVVPAVEVGDERKIDASRVSLRQPTLIEGIGGDRYEQDC